jgi:hypothetical protein
MGYGSRGERQPSRLPRLYFQGVSRRDAGGSDGRRLQQRRKYDARVLGVLRNTGLLALQRPPPANQETIFPRVAWYAFFVERSNGRMRKCLRQVLVASMEQQDFVGPLLPQVNVYVL